MKKIRRIILIVLPGLLLAFPLFSMTYYTMVRTSTPHFCASCHEIQWAYNTWKLSSHTNNAVGVMADCMDCHLPAPQNTIDFFYSKTMHGIKDIVAHFTMDYYDHEENRQAAYKDMHNDRCLKCHRNLLSIPYSRGAMLAHRSVLYPRQGYEKQCISCHNNLVHNEKPFHEYRQ